MKLSKTKKIIGLMLLILIILATSNVFINKVFAVTTIERTVNATDGSPCNVKLSVYDRNGNLLDLSKSYNFNYMDAIGLRYVIAIDVDYYVLKAMDDEGNEYEVNNNVAFAPYFQPYIAGADYPGYFEVVKAWSENRVYYFEYKLKETTLRLDDITWDYNLNIGRCMDGDYYLCIDYNDKTPDGQFEGVYLSFEDISIYVDAIAPKVILDATTEDNKENEYYKGGTKITAWVHSDENLYNSSLTSECAPDIEICFGDGEWKSLVYRGAVDESKSIFDTHMCYRHYYYEYVISEEDHGELKMRVKDKTNVCDIVGNEPNYVIVPTWTQEGYKPGIYADTKAPTGTVNYIINADKSVTAIVTFNEENVTITNNLGENTYIFTENGEFTFTFKDKVGNEGSVKAEVTSIQMKEPEVKFKTFKIIEESGKVYVRVGQKVTAENLKADIDNEALIGKKVEIENLTSDGELKTGSKIIMDGDVQCIVVVSGDVDGAGEITFMGDIIRGNNYRLGLIDIQPEQKLALDIECDGKIDFIQDLIRINNYRLKLIDSLDFI